MEIITSRTNPLCTHLRKLASSVSYRRDCGEFLCDSPKLLEEALLWREGRINRLIKRFEDEKSNEIQELKNEIKDLKSRALVNPKKITDKQVNEVKELRALGLSYRKIAERTSLGTTTICRIINGEYE